MTGERLEAADVARMLGERIAVLAPQLLSGAPWRDGEIWRWGSLSGEEGQSLAVWVGGPKRGRWYEFNGGHGGDSLDLVAKTRCGGDLGDALKWARDWLGLGHLSDEERREQAARARQAALRREDEDRRRRERRSRDAKAIWLAGTILQRGDVVWRYLAGRGIDLSLLPRLPGAIRAHPGLAHYAAGPDGGGKMCDGTWPAMVAAISGPDGTHLATQRTWLAVQSNGEVKKAYAGKNGKMSLGLFKPDGGAIHLARGASGKPWREAAADEVIGFAEGIEDGLTFACWRPDLRVAAAATSLAYLAHVALPPAFAEGRGRAVVIAQNDPRGSEAMRAQARGIAGLRAKRVAVDVFRPPVWLKDANDFAQWLRHAQPEEAA